MSGFRWPRIWPLPVFVGFCAPDGMAYCTHCATWRRYDVIPAVETTFGLVPPFVICVRCGFSVDYQLEEAS